MRHRPPNVCAHLFAWAASAGKYAAALASAPYGTGVLLRPGVALCLADRRADRSGAAGGARVGAGAARGPLQGDAARLVGRARRARRGHRRDRAPRSRARAAAASLAVAVAE